MRISSRQPLLKRIKPYLYHIEFESREAMNSAAVRFYGYYEDSEFKGKTGFTTEQFLKSFEKVHDRHFDNSWSGFNFPGQVFEPFQQGFFDPLSSAEKEILGLIRKIQDRDFYLIFTYKQYAYNHETLPHEIAHGLWKFNPDYRREVESVLATVDLNPLLDALKNVWHYHDDVLMDEAAGFILTNDDMMRQEGIDIAPFAGAKAKLKQIYDKYVDN